MTDNEIITNSMIGNIDNLELAAKEAIRAWIETEGKLSDELKSMSVITGDFLRKFVKDWILINTRMTLGGSNEKYAEYAKQLNDLVKPKIMDYSDEELPLKIQSITEELKKTGVTARKNGTKTMETSLVSKFAFCLRPEIIVPYDDRAKKGLKELYGKKIKDHDYASYLELFKQFEDEVDGELEASGFLKNLRSDCPRLPAMSENLFKARTADKLLMMKGGFSVETMSKAVQKYFNSIGC